MLGQVRPYLIIKPLQPNLPLINQEKQIRPKNHLQIKNPHPPIIIHQIIRQHLQPNRCSIHDEPPKRGEVILAL